MNRLVTHGAVGLLLVAQAAVGLLPQVPWPCLTYDQRCPCLPAEDACCANGGSTVPVAPIQCECNRDRAPTALVSVNSAAAGLPDPAALSVACVAVEPRFAAVRWQSINARRALVPDIPVRILFCTWLE
jgi:hypothetical protein